jgi:hypothetical protein
VAALEAELALAPADIRLGYKQQSYTARLRMLPDNNRILQLCPNTFPNTLDIELELALCPLQLQRQKKQQQILCQDLFSLAKSPFFQRHHLFSKRKKSVAPL